MLTPPPRRAWGTRFDSLVDTPPDLRPHDANLDFAAEKERSLDYDGANPRSPMSTMPSSNDAYSLPIRMPHDASVFVASLPSHIPEPELQSHLSVHLSSHATIKHIKLIRDNRGAVCAFVQVESAAQAANLIAACNLSLFMDRQIRCEVARAFRTLLVAWRPPGAPLGSGTISTEEETVGKALRLRRCKGSRYIQVSHGSDALNANLAHLPNYSPPRAEDPLSGAGIFFPSGIVEGDYEALKGLLEAFGPLEFITPFEPTPMLPDREETVLPRGGLALEQKEGNETPSIEATPRPHMWAAKWEHRNDAVSAITALQHVPRLFICWSHTYGRPYQPPHTPRVDGEVYPRGSFPAHVPSYPPMPYQADSHLHSDSDIDARNAEERWAATGPRFQHPHAQTQGPDSLRSQQSLPFSESDFPPLRVENNSSMLGARGRIKRNAWVGRKNFVRAGAPSPPPISTSMPAVSHVCDGADTPASGVPHTPDLDSAVEPSPVTPGFPITPRTSSGSYAPGEDMQKEAVYGYAAFPQRRTDDSAGDGRELFIGGLDAATWDETRLQNVFGRFGVLEEVRFVRPGFHAPPFKRAFAFIRFADQDASQKAIAEEHLRLYDDRKIKVQLREATGRRWAYRGRGRYQHGLLRSDHASLDFDHDSADAEMGEGKHIAEVSGHVRFASAPDATSMKSEMHPGKEVAEKDTNDVSQIAVEHVPYNETEEARKAFVAKSVLQQQDMNPDMLSTSSTGSDDAPEASMEAQSRSADTTITLADVTVSPVVQTGEPAHQEQSEQDTFTAVSSTPPPSNPDAVSTYAPSSEGSAPTSTGYYPSTPSWIPPYSMTPAPYNPYGYYPQQLPGGSSTEAQTAYPWMTALYRNVLPFVPWFNPPPGVELAAPPVRPTGYIQRDPGGIFIPIYPPERLGQYMSTSGGAVDQSQSQGQASSVPSGNWQNFQPPHPQLYPVPFHVQQAMVMQQHVVAAAQQQQLTMAGSGWIPGPPPAMGYPSQQAASSSAPPPYPSSHNTYYQAPSSATPTHTRPNAYGCYDPPPQSAQKHANRRGAEYGQHQHRFGSRESRAASQRRGHGGVNSGDQSFGNGTTESQISYSTKPNSALPIQLGVTPSGSHDSTWNWSTQNR